MRILTTALVSVILLKKHITKLQWLSLCILVVGVCLVHLQPNDTKTSMTSADEQNRYFGLLAVGIMCLMTAFAGVNFEKILKGTSQSIWLRNIQLGFIGCTSGYLTLLLDNNGEIFDDNGGFFQGYDWVVWLIILLQSLGGLMVAVVIKYTDNILKSFSTSNSIILSCMASVYFFDFQLSWEFVTGASLVMLSVCLYSYSTQE